MPKSVYTNLAPQAIGPYAQGVVSGNLFFSSGQIAIDPKTNNFENDSFEIEVKQVLLNIKGLLCHLNTDVAQIVKVSVFLTSMDDFEQFNKLYAEFFEGAKTYPARETVEVRRLPKDARIEMSFIAGIK